MARKTQWAAFPYPEADYDFAGARLAKAWKKLHPGDLEPFPDEARVTLHLAAHPGPRKPANAGAIAKDLQQAWRAFHRGDFHEAYDLGVAHGPLGASVAIKAAGIHAVHLLDDDTAREKRFAELVTLGEAAMAALPDEANAHFRYAFALGRYSQCISIAKALTQGLAGKVKAALERTLERAPDHAEAHTALGLYHAEVISKVGSMIGGLTYGAKASTGEALLKRAIALTPDSPIAHIEYGNGLMLLHGSKKENQAADEYAIAAGIRALDAMERLDAEHAAAQLED